MAYFSNGTEGEVFDEQCAKCKYGERECPIALVQISYNYDAVDNETATSILNMLVKDNGACMMYKMAENDFFVQKENLFGRE